jgi:hypothetical protein
MRKLLRGIYRLFIKNRFIRWVWILGLAIWGFRMATERGLAWRKHPLSKTVIEIAPEQIANFTIRQGDSEMLFTRGDSSWLVVRNNITEPVPLDSIQPFLSVFEKMDRLAVKFLLPSETKDAKASLPIFSQHTEGGRFPKIDISVIEKNGSSHSFSIFYTEIDSLSNSLLSYIQLPNENMWHGIKGDLYTVFQKNFDDYRDHTLLHFDKLNLHSFSLEYPNDTVRVLRRDTLFYTPKRRIANFNAQNYIQSLQILRGGKIIDGDHDRFVPRKITNRLRLYFHNDSTTLTAYRLDKGFALHSTQNPDTYFQVDSLPPVFPVFSNFTPN